MPAFLFEVGTEELPASFVADACQQWRSLVPASLDEAYLTPEAVEVYATPRRLAVLLRGLPDRQPDRDEEVKGPPAQAAFKSGKPTKAAEGFARKQGVAVADLEIRPTGKGDFVFVNKSIPGRPARELLLELAPQWVSGLEGKRFMRWADGDFRFPRPIRWLVALLDAAVLPVTLTLRAARDDRAASPKENRPAETLTAGRVSRGHRVLHPEPVELARAEDYAAALRSASVVVDGAERQRAIETQTRKLAKSLGGEAQIPPDLLAEVRDLVEFPTAIAGRFDGEFLELPSEVNVTVMVTHQRYFPVTEPGHPDRLLPHFIAISNGDPAKSDLIARGNERVVRARLDDGQFFYRADCQQPLEAFLPKLETVTFQEKLGSMREKVDRIAALTETLGDRLQVAEDDLAVARRAALLCKADLVTQMVGEFPELQGIMGEKYARASGEPDAVATAIAEHYRPRGAGDALPDTLPGQLVAIADRLDTLVGIFSLGMLPSGSSDPFALRRAANAVLNILWTARLPLDLEALIAPEDGDRWGEGSFGAELADFFVQRIRSLLQDEQGIDYDLANAVLGDGDAAGADPLADFGRRALRDPLDALTRARFLQGLRAAGTLGDLYAVANRASRLAVKGDLGFEELDPRACVDRDRFQQPSEADFYQALVELLPATEAARASRDYEKLVDALSGLAPAVEAFFDGPHSVLVMDEDPEVRRNRLNLLGLLRNHARVLADVSAIVKESA